MGTMSTKDRTHNFVTINDSKLTVSNGGFPIEGMAASYQEYRFIKIWQSMLSLGIF